MKRFRYWILSLAAVLGVSLYFLWDLSASASVGAAAMAKVSCSCVFVDGRTLESCRADDPPGFESITVSINSETQVAIGSVWPLASRTARYHPEFGCTLEP